MDVNEYMLLSVGDNTQAENNTQTGDNTQTENNTQEGSESTESSIALDFHPQGFLDQLPTMGIGMLGIGIVMMILIVSTTILNRITAPKKKKEE